jgi:hypothetical protein
MAKIILRNLDIVGSELFQDSETFLIDLKDDDLHISGGFLSLKTVSVVDIMVSEDIFSKSISRIV